METLETTKETTKSFTDFKTAQEFKSANDIVIPDIMFKPIQIGHTDLDQAFSELGGLIPSQVIMFTGMPGAGKTTLCSEILSRCSVRYQDRPSVFLSFEMSDFQLKLVAKKTSGFGKVLINSSAKYEDIDSLISDLRMMNPSVVVLDSIQGFAGEGNRNQINCVNAFTAFAKEQFIPLILIGHADKGGRYKGPSTLLHQVDTHLKVGISKETGERLIEFGKNRFGGILNPLPFRIQSDKVLIGADVWSAYEKATESEEDLQEAFSKFHEINQGQKFLDWESCKEVSHVFMSYMKKEYEKQFEYVVGDLAKSTMNFQDKTKNCYCRPATGEIFMSRQTARSLNDEKLSYGYRKERPFETQVVRSKQDEYLWILFHEFTHLIIGNGKHTKSFFQNVLNIAKENMWMFSETAQEAQES